jgi:hypothetical protein
MAPSFGVEVRPIDLRDATEIERAARNPTWRRLGKRTRC